MKSAIRKMLVAVFAASTVLVTPGFAQQSKIPKLSLTKIMINSAKPSLVAFSNYRKLQHVYFSIIMTHHCNLAGLNYWINDEREARQWTLPECNPHLPYNIDPVKTPIYFTQPLGSIQKITVNIVYKDGSSSGDLTYTPCDNVGDNTCALMVE